MIDAIGGAPTTWAPQSAGANSWLQNALQPVADKLGTDTSSLIQQLQGGASLSQIADQKGLSRSDLISAIEQGLQQNAPPGADGSSDLSTLANRIADRHGLHGGHRHHGAKGAQPDPSSLTGVGGQSSNDLTTLAGLLQMPADQLLQQLQGGTSLLDLATRQGVSADSLASYLQPGLALDQVA